MPSLPWVDAIKARAARLAEKLEHKRGAEVHRTRTERAAGFIVSEDIPRLLRAVEVLGEVVEQVATHGCMTEDFHGGTCEDCLKEADEVGGDPLFERCLSCYARRALADVQSLPSAPGATEE